MNLRVLNDEAAPWYADGLNFTCTQCGNCCTGGPGFVWVTREEIRRIAEHLKLTPRAVVEKYCRKVAGRISLKERITTDGLHDCIFLTETDAPATSGEGVRLKRRGCSIYSVRPLQCRTWPFWSENLENKQAWNNAARKCHGMNNGSRFFERRRIEEIRDATDWPHNPPSSKKR